ncbi:MAG: glutamate--tRNA ligase [Gammaproteobacteria bacterium]|nr:glutamate--tRNA ligase [Gammaproteobacteria bacterium]MBT3723870.1 glutamate--tRNA ligase [Gammaproteobacteria bacterium]MBT4076012.1 glutamate--tRNA ligase [Gammaproteobacteria bacterium]MBT4193953.1 glutamate--tRNA ligase [Gammaproteobacteria bacterium]MBT4452340.1 glutamate--tRNA ligase [Gammaproteobacteria bacterium]
MMIRTRFAPSPTGYLHIGGARTALFSWLFSKKMGGDFVLRVEDTDRERSTDESVQAILQAMEWLQLDYDEGPFYQTHRFDRYEEVIQQLIDNDHAYYCSCSKERLESLRNEQMANKQKPRYDGCCRDKKLKSGELENMVVRFRNPQRGEVVFNDLVKGEITVSNNELDDLIIARSDGTPTYNLTVVVDDSDMNITHVVRGDDHVNNTPRQINIFKALGVSIPLFAHVPMILGEDGKRLSKRHGAVSVMQYLEEGYLPEALLNYLVRLGWSHGDQELFSVDEMQQLFSLEGINRAPSTFNPEKLSWINQQYLKTKALNDIVELVKQRLSKNGVTLDDDLDISSIVDLYRERVKTINELADSILYFFQDFEEYDPKAAKKAFKEAALQPLQLLHDKLSELDSWSTEEIHAVIQNITEELGVNMGKVGQPLRVAVTGGSFSPPIDQTVEKIGRESSLARIQRAIEYIK